MDELIRRCNVKIQGWKERSKCCKLERMYDWKNLGNDALKGHIHPHYICFFLKDEKPVMQWEHYSFDTKWVPKEPYFILASISEKAMSPKWASIQESNVKAQSEIDALQAFIAYKQEMMSIYPS